MATRAQKTVTCAQKIVTCAHKIVTRAHKLQLVLYVALQGFRSFVINTVLKIISAVLIMIVILGLQICSHFGTVFINSIALIYLGQ